MRAVFTGPLEFIAAVDLFEQCIPRTGVVYSVKHSNVMGM